MRWRKPRGVSRGRARASTVVAAVVGAAGIVGVANVATTPLHPAASTEHLADWQRTPDPVGKGDITAVAALSEQDAWAVGYRLNGLTDLEPLALRWDGRSWRQQSVLPKGSAPQELAVHSAHDVWVAGTSTAHWDGKTWTSFPLQPDPVGRVRPNDLATADNGRAWVVGQALPGDIKSGVPAVQFWNGTSWQRHVLPEVGKGELSSVVALAPDDVWAAGVTYAAGENAPQATLLLHWDGVRWQRVDPPSPGGDRAWISGLTALGPHDVWAVGGSSRAGVDQPLALHWDGRRWTHAITPTIADGRLREVFPSGNGDLWAVGGKGAVSVALRWNSRAERWDPAADPDVQIRSATGVPGGPTLWAVGIGKQGDLAPAISRFRP